MSFAASNRSRAAARRDDLEESERLRLMTLLTERGPMTSLQIMRADTWYSSATVVHLLNELVADGQVVRGRAANRTTYDVAASAGRRRAR